MDIGKRIKELRLQKNLSQEELATLMKYKSRSTINKIELGISDISSTKVNEFARVLGTTTSYLMGWDDSTANNYNFVSEQIIPIRKIKIALLGKVACGKPIFAEEEHECYVDSINNIKADFALKATGNSMIDARIYDGDIVFVKQQEQVENGEIAVVLIDDEATLKRFFFDKEKQTVTLLPANPKYAPLIYTGEEINKIRIIGKAVAFQSKL